jgi:polyhydroxyalkanoate synthase
MSASDVKEPKKKGVGERLSKLVDRTIQRNIKGVEYFVSAAPPVGLTPKDTVFQRGTARLYHYRPVASEIYRIPILMVMATTNRAYVFDIAEQNSFVGFLTKQGYDVYVLDWEAPRPEESGLRFEDYTQDFIPDAIRHIQKRSGETDVNLVGYCMGGVLSLMYAATHPDGPLKNLVCFTTPIDYREMGLFAHMSSEKHFDVDRLVDAIGNIPPDMLMASFDMLAPTKKPSGRVELWKNMWNDDYVENHRKFDRWANEMLPLAGEYFRQTTKELMWKNSLYEGTLEIGGKSANLANITVPVFHAVAQHDHIVPYAASSPLVQKVGSKDKTEIVLKGGHISLIAGLNAVTRLWPVLDEWLAERSV